MIDDTVGARYTIRVRERLADHWSEWFSGMSVTTDADGTVLTGTVVDETALHAVLTRIYDLGLHLISVNRTTDGHDDDQ